VTSRARGFSEPCSGLDVSVKNHYCLGQGTEYTQHFFTIEVSLSAHSLQFSVDRSYVDFVDLYRRLVKRFPSTSSHSPSLPPLPLDGTKFVEAQLVKGAKYNKEKDSSSSFNTVRETLVNDRSMLSIRGSCVSEQQQGKLGAVGQIGRSIFSSLTPTKQLSFACQPPPSSYASSPPCATITEENIPGKLNLLNEWLKIILTVPEVLGLEELLLFLDEEASSMAQNTRNMDALSVHELLLLNTRPPYVTVGRY